MSLPLAELYRPTTFDEVVGQDVTVKSLKKILKRGNAKTFLFSGPSGCGKTTLAKICAAEVGCTENAIMSVDAATNTGVDNVREIQDVVKYLPMGSKARAVIIDECHMLSKAAWNSLLMITEKPPKHLYWFFCTTEPGKVIPTIKTRSSAYTLKPVATRELHEVAARVLEAEEIDLNPKILKLVISEAGGSPRQMLSNLEVCLSAKNSKEAAALLESAEASDNTIELCRLLVSGKATWKSAIKIVREMKTENPESVRIVLLNYISAVLLKTESARDAQRLLAIIDAFSAPYNLSEKRAPLLLSLGTVLT